MAGCDLVVISGIDGSFEEFELFLEQRISIMPRYKLPYDRNLSFAANVIKMRDIINSHKDQVPIIIVGWSIGAAAAAFLSDCKDVKICVMINSFYDRREILNKRNIQCDEDVLLEKSYRLAPRYVIIRGELDDKISPEQSEKILALYPSSKRELHSFPFAKHRLSSFPIEDLANIINRKIQQL